MEDSQPVQCLIFYAEESSTSSENCPSTSTGNTKSSPPSDEISTVFAVLPQVFKEGHLDVLPVFRKNGIQFLDEVNLPSLDVNKLRVLEIRLDGGPAAALNPLAIGHPRHLGALVKSLFHSTPIKTSVLRYEREKVTLPAVDETNLGGIESILSQKIDIPCSFGRCFSGNLLHVAATSGPAAFVNSLLDGGLPIDQGEGSDREFSPLHLTVIGGAPVAIVQLLIRRGASIDVRESIKGATPLFFPDDLKVAEILLENGADPNCYNSEEITPLVASIETESLDFTRLLLKHGAQVNVNFRNRPLLMVALRLTSPQVFSYLLNHSFSDPTLLKEVLTPDVVERIVYEALYYRSSQYVIPNKEALSHHIVKVSTLTQHNILSGEQLDSLWGYSFIKQTSDFRSDCEIEVARLKNLELGDTHLSLHEVLTKNEHLVARLLRNTYVAQLAEQLPDQFPLYGGMISCHFEKGKRRKTLEEEGITHCNLLFKQFCDVPEELVEKVVVYLSNRDLVNLKISVGRN